MKGQMMKRIKKKRNMKDQNGQTIKKKDPVLQMIYLVYNFFGNRIVYTI